MNARRVWCACFVLMVEVLSCSVRVFDLNYSQGRMRTWIMWPWLTVREFYNEGLYWHHWTLEWVAFYLLKLYPSTLSPPPNHPKRSLKLNTFPSLTITLKFWQFVKRYDHNKPDLTTVFTLRTKNFWLCQKFDLATTEGEKFEGQLKWVRSGKRNCNTVMLRWHFVSFRHCPTMPWQ